MIKSSGEGHRLLRAIAIGFAALALSTQANAQVKRPKQSMGGTLTLKDEGTFYVHGKKVSTQFSGATAPGAPLPAPATIMIEQMYVHYRIPAKVTNYPIVFVHGGGLTGQSYETTPDGREGWATYFARKGFPTYVVDFPTRGRAAFNPIPIHQGKYEQDWSKIPAFSRSGAERLWTAFRFGPVNGEKFPRLAFPVEAMDGLLAQGFNSTDATITDRNSFVFGAEALIDLLDQIGPAILVVHSQSGPFPDPVVEQRPGLVKAVINIEGFEGLPPNAAQIAAYAKVPLIDIFGDNVIGNTTGLGEGRYNGRKATIDKINAAGGKAEIVLLANAGLYGNTHMLMQDKNNDKIADLLIKWIDKKAPLKGGGKKHDHYYDPHPPKGKK
jgi:pimeloyl-ACP methyl ester carboxylesterase